MANASSDRLEFKLLHDTHPLRIEAAAGAGPTLIVSFTSVGTERHKWPPKEFISLASQAGENHVICITDISRSWMNSDGMDTLIVTTLNDYIAAHGITEVMAIGVSMGGYNALVLAKLMPVSRVIAFAPQYSVHPDVVPEEKRWKFFRRQITDWPYREMDSLPGSETTVYMFHGDTPDERMHWQKYPLAENVKHYIFHGGDHVFVTKLKENGVLEKIMRAAVNNRPGRMRKVVMRAGGMRRAEYEAS